MRRATDQVGWLLDTSSLTPCTADNTFAGCAFYEVWDKEDSVNQGRPVFCRLIRSEVIPEFRQVFGNPTYRVLQLS